MSDKTEALAALADMERMILRVCPRPGEVRLERDTVLDLVRRFRGWVEAYPEPTKFRHTPFAPHHIRADPRP